MIFYFSGTGNSFHVARQIVHDQGEKLVSIAQAMEEKQWRYSLDLHEKVGFVFPVYAWRPPKIVTDFIERVQLERFLNPYLFAVCTCGEDAGDTMKILRSTLRKRVWHLDSTAAVVMPNNYILSYDIDNEALQREKLKKAEQTIDEINQSISQRKKGVLCEASGKFPVLKTRIIGFGFGIPAFPVGNVKRFVLSKISRFWKESLHGGKSVPNVWLVPIFVPSRQFNMENRL